MLPLLSALLVACAPPAEDDPPHPGGSLPQMGDPTSSQSPSAPTPPPTATTGSGGSGDSGATIPVDTGSPTGARETGDTGGDTAVPPLDATGAWIGQCVYYGAPVQIELDLVDTVGVVTGAGTLHLAGYPQYVISVSAGTRVGAAVELTGELSDPAHGYAEPAAWSGLLAGDTMDGNLTLNQGGGLMPSLACTTAR